MEEANTIISDIIAGLFAVDSIWSVVLRGALWFVIAIVIIVSVDKANPEESTKSLKANLGFFLMFLILSGTLVYMLFGYSPSATATG
jgi:hypothetical protein